MTKKKYDIETDTKDYERSDIEAGTESGAVSTKTEPAFSKEQLQGSKRYGNRADVLSCIMTDSERLTFAEVDNRIEKFMKGGK